MSHTEHPEVEGIDHEEICITTFGPDGAVVLSQDACIHNLHDPNVIEHMGAAPKGYYNTVLSVPHQLH